jgi:hypothetical protein
MGHARLCLYHAAEIDVAAHADGMCPLCMTAKIESDAEVIAALSGIPPAVAAILAKWQTTAHMTLHAGEMSAQEIRSVRAVLKAVSAEVMKLLPPTDEQTAGEKS